MCEYLDLPTLPEYVSIKEDAKMLGVSNKRVYAYIEDGRLPAVHAAHVIWSTTHPGMLEILFIWRSTTMPREANRAEALDQFQRALADVQDWNTAQYNNGEVLMHT